MSKSTSEVAIIPKEVFKKGLKRVFRYSGLSMTPTFQTGELLYVRPDVRDVRPGDVVVYKQEGQYIVHRVLSVEKNGFITRGDNNRFPDADPVTLDQIIGRVEIKHWSGITSVRGGRRGLSLVRLTHLTKRFQQRLRLVFGWPYRLVKASGFMNIIWKPLIHQVHYKTDKGILVKYIYHKKKVAVWEPSRERFECRKPFDLVISHPKEQK